MSDSIGIKPSAETGHGASPYEVHEHPAQSNLRQDPGQSPGEAALKPAPGEVSDQVKLSQEAQQLRQLAARDQEVRTHEAAHSTVGGAYAGAPSYVFELGPDGRRYATGGEVQISVAEVPGNPQATLAKAETVRAAALAPQNPSAADRRIAAKASQMAIRAQAEISVETANQNREAEEKTTKDKDSASPSGSTAETLQSPGEAAENVAPGQIVDLHG